MNLSKAVGLILLVGAVLFVVALVNVGNHAVDVVASQAVQPDSATDLIMQSRKTAAVEPAQSQNTGWWGAGLLAFGIVLIGGAVFLFRGGAEFLRQWRLTLKPSARHQHRSRSPQATPYYPTWPELPTTPSLRYLPEVDDEEDLDPFA